MPRYAYTAVEGSGRRISGERDAANASLLAGELAAAGMTPLGIAPVAEDGGEDAAGFRWWQRPLSLDELILFSHQMASLTRAGISLVRAIRGLAESSKQERMRTILMEVSSNLETGMDLASSFRRFPKDFSELYASVIHVGENTGRLDEAFRQIASYLEVERETKRRIQTATRYPMFVLGAIGLAVVVLNVFVIPAFADVFDKFHAELPWQTRAIIGASDFFVAWWPALLLAGVGAVIATRHLLATEQGRLRWDRAKLRLPILGPLFERIMLSRFCKTYAMVSKSGLPITQGLLVIANAIGNAHMALKVRGMREGIERGNGIYQTARESDMFTPVVLQMIAVGEETGSVDELLEQAAGFFEEEVDFDLKSLTDAIEPLLIIAIAVLVLILALGVFLPLWDLSGVANG